MQNSALLFFQIPLLTSDGGIVDKKIIFFSELYKKYFERVFDQFFNSNQIAYNNRMFLVQRTQLCRNWNVCRHKKTILAKKLRLD